MSDELEALCQRIPGLEKVGDTAWRSAAGKPLSYPEHGLDTLAPIEDSSYWFNHRNAVITTVVARYPPQGIVFDIGGGNGFVSRGLASAGFPAAVVEPDASGAATARRRGLPTIEAPFENLELPEGSIGAAGMFDVLEHIEDEAGALDRLSRSMRFGGLAYIAVPALQALWSPQDVYSGHFRRYSLRSLAAAVRRAGLTPLFATYFFAMLVPAVAAFRVLPGMIGRRPTGDAASTEQDHRLPSGLAGRLLKASFDRELHRIAAGRPVRIGSSCLVVARKT